MRGSRPLTPAFLFNLNLPTATMAKKKEPKYKGKQCITWLDSDGNRHRSRFYKGTSVNIIDKKLFLRQANITCYEPEVMSKKKWVVKFGEVDPPKRSPVRYRDPKMTEPTYEMKAWKQQNRNNYYNCIY